MNRRTATTAGRQQQQQQQRTPQTSIKSSQAFANQPTREQTQYQQMNSKKQLQQQQLQQLQQSQQSQQSQQMRNYPHEYQEEYTEKDNVRNITKMTVAQAITLITLRLGSIETKLMNDTTTGDKNIDGESLINVSNRLDSLETKINLSSSSDYKQQIDHLTQAIIQSRNMSNSFVKENKELKTQLATLKKEMSDTREIIEMVRNIAVSNENKIFQILNISNDFQMDEQIEMKIETETDLSFSDSENDIVETDIRQTFENNCDDNEDELQMTKIEHSET